MKIFIAVSKHSKCQVICYWAWVNICCTSKNRKQFVDAQSETVWTDIDIDIYSCKLPKLFLNFIKCSKLFVATHGI